MAMAAASGSATEAWAVFLGVAEDHPGVASLAAASRMHVIKRGVILLQEAGRDDTVFLVAAGVLRTARYTQEGQEVWFTDIKKGELIGEIAALTGGPRSSSVTAATAAVVFGVERAVFLEIARLHGQVGLAVARLLARRLVNTSTQVADLAALSVQNRLHRELARLSTSAEDGKVIVRFSDTPSVTQLGHRIHATREATSRALRDLEMRGLLARSDEAWILLSAHEATLLD